VGIAGNLSQASIQVNLAGILVSDIVAQVHDQRGWSAAHTKSSARSAGVRRVVGSTVRNRVVEDLDLAGPCGSVVGNAGNVDAGERSALLQWIHAAYVIDHVVVGLHRPLGGIDSGEVDAVAVVAVDQVVVNMKIELVETRGIPGAAGWAAQRRGVKLQGAAGEV